MGMTRVTWVDAAKGMAIILVVLHHVSQSLRAIGLEHEIWHQADFALRTLRMPLFFLVSGLFASKALHLTGRIFRKRRVWPFLYIYVVWGFIYVISLAAIESIRGNNFIQSSIAVLGDVLRTDTGLWYMLALSAYFAATYLMRTVPPAWQLSAAAILSALAGAGILLPDAGGYTSIVLNFVFFLLGRHFRDGIAAVAPALSRPLIFLCVFVIWAGLTGVVVFSDFQQVPGVVLVLSLTALPFGIGAATILARFGERGIFARLGNHTLQIYLLHILVIAGLLLALEPLASQLSGTRIVLPPIVALVVVGLSGALGRALRPARLLFAMPTRSIPGPRAPLPGKQRGI